MTPVTLVWQGNRLPAAAVGMHPQKRIPVAICGNYFFCSDSMYLFRLAMRCWTSVSCPPLMLQNKLPQIGISLVPWAARTCSPPMIAATLIAGYLPPFFTASAVRSVGGTFNASAAGPLPLPSRSEEHTSELQSL